MTGYILGLHGFSSHSKRLLHDTGVSLIQDGKIIAALNEERISRQKNDGKFPKLSYKKLCETYNLKPDDIIAVAFPDKRSIWQTYNILKYILKTYKETGIFAWRYLWVSIKRGFDYKRIPPGQLKNKPIYYIEHHLCHAASAYYTSPWDDAAIVTLDGMGDWCIGGTINIGENGKIKNICKTNGFYSPGFFYMYITSLLGYTPGRHEGKIMGLAAYGDSNKCYKVAKELIKYRKEKHDFYSALIPEILKTARYVDGNMESDFTVLKKIFKDQKPEDIAAATQRRFEEVIVDYIKDAIKLTGKKYLVVAGGVFANVKINEMIMKLPEIENIYIYPNMGDGGLSVGASLYVYHNFINKKRALYQPDFLSTVYLGPEYFDADIKSLLERRKANYEYVDNIEEKIAQAIHVGKIIGLFHGRMEYGPRALGNRSILAAPIDKTINKWLNKRLNRTEFMPFAPSILEEDAKLFYPDYESDHVAARFMTITYRVENAFAEQAPAVVHVDKTARPHVVRKQDNPFFYNIINAYKNLSGLPLVINTSFNMHEEPIICSPEDALRAFSYGSVDVLVLGNFWIELKRNQHLVKHVV
jgi:carbamoyltransferase